MIHIAVIRRRFVDLILDGTKTAELRLNRHRIVPHGRVFEQERIYIKQVSGPIRATAIVARVESYTDLTPDRIRELERDTHEAVRGYPEFFRERENARYASVIHLEHVEACAHGPDFSVQRAANPRAAWLMLPDSACVHPAHAGPGVASA